MSQQQQFEDSPENSPNSQPFVNPDPRERGPLQEGQNQGYQAGYSAMPGQYGEKVYPIRRRRSRFRWLWRTLLIILILGALSGGLYGANQALGHSAALTTQTISTIQNEPKLVVTSSLGTVNIHAGGSGSIVIAGTKHTGFLGNLNNVQVNVTPHTSNNEVNEVDVNVQSSNQGLDFLNGDSVDLNITVPSLTDIQDTSNAQTLNIDGVNGQMNLHANAGTINVTNAGLTGSSSITANAGTINYSGALAPNGTYNFQANAGTINLTLRGNPAFNLDATVNAGSVNNDFGSNTVGDQNSAAQIHAHANAGSINIHKG